MSLPFCKDHGYEPVAGCATCNVVDWAQRAENRPRPGPDTHGALGQLLQEGDVYVVWLRDEGRAMMARLFVEDERTLRLQPVDPTRRSVFKAVRDVEVKGRVLKTLRCY